MFSLDVIQKDYCYIFVFLLLLMLLLRNRSLKKIVRVSFWRLMAMSFCLFLLQYLGAALRLQSNTDRWCTLVTYVKYALNPILLFQVLMISEREKSLRTKIILAIPLMIEILVLVVSYPNNWVAYHDPITNNWNGGPLLPVTWIVLFIYLALIILSAIKTHMSQDECFFLLLGEGIITVNIVYERLFSRSIPGMENAVIILGLLIYYLNFCFHSVDEYKIIKEKELNQAQIQAMISQVKPHFIYNTLACIAETCHNDAEKGEEAILSFSSYLRSCFQSLTDEGMVPFSEELSTIEHYIEMEKMQSPEKLTMHYDIQERFFQVPILSVETLVENAVKHGIRKKHGNGNVTLRTYRDHGRICITILDDGIGFDSENQILDETHLGIRIAGLRLAEQCGASLEIQSRIDHGTKVTIIIPEGKNI